MPKPNLKALVEKLMIDEELEPAGWLGNRRSPGKPPSHAELGIAASPELAQYIELAEEPAFRKQVAAIVQGAFYWGLVSVREPESILFTVTASQVVAFLIGSSVLGTDPDSGAYLIASWGDAKSSSIVASFLFNDVAPSDKKYGDFVVEALSIAGWLESYGKNKGRPKESLPKCKELARLYRRAIWIAQLIQADDSDSDRDLPRTIRDASPRTLYVEERKLFAKHAHLAAYWLLAHGLIGEPEDLADALKHTEKSKNPVVQALRKILADPKALPKLFAKHRPDLQRTMTLPLATIVPLRLAT
jgi:hypothetical protein